MNPTLRQGRARGGRPAQISRAQIIRAALTVIDAEGLDALTMRRIGEQLGVAAMSLYRHVPNREAVLAAVVDELVASVLIDLDPGSSWSDAVLHLAHAYRGMLLEHPHAVPLLAVHPVDIDTGLALMSEVLGRFAEAGVDTETALTVVQSAVVFTLGHALAEVGSPPGTAAEPRQAAARDYYQRWFVAGLDALVQGFRITLP